jgi:two-component system NtrC family sensor kinase
MELRREAAQPSMEKPKDIEKQVYAEALRKAAHDYEELVREFSILRLLNDSIQVGLDFTEICRNLVQFVTEMMNVENASVMVIDPEKKDLRLLVAKGVLEENGTFYIDRKWPGKAFHLGEGIAGRAAAEKKSILINDTLRDSRFVIDAGQKVNIRSLLSIPLIHEDRVHGVLNISNSSPQAFSKKREHALTIIASTASVTMSYALAVEQLKQVNAQTENRNKELAAVIELSELLHASLELDVVIEKSLKTILDGFAVDGVAIFLKEEESPTAGLSACKSRRPEDLKSLFVLLNERYGQALAMPGKPLIHEHLMDESIGKQFPFARKLEFLAIPLCRGDSCSGYLMVVSFEGAGFLETEMKLLISFCNQIGVAIHNCRLILRLKKNIDELQEARRKLIQADKLALLGEMLSSVAHEINSPLAAILGYSDLLRAEESLLPEQSKMLEKIILSVDRTRKIVQGLLSFARKTELQKRPANIYDLIDRALEHREHDLRMLNIEIIRKLEKTHRPVALVDPNQIEQVFLNLINNAFDAMAAKGEGGKLVIASDFAGADTIRIEFADTGHGIKETDRQKIFEPFFTTKAAGKGTGLGLSISYGIIKEHGGNLYLDEHYQDGAKLVVELPLASDEEQGEHVEAPSDLCEQVKPKGRVLVIDDEEIVLDFLKRALCAEGLAVDCASTGEEASSLLKKNVYDLLLSDIKMPGPLDGRRLFLQCKKENPELAERFIFLTGDIVETETADFLKQSGCPYLLKPFPLKDLRQIISDTLRKISKKRKSQ